MSQAKVDEDKLQDARTAAPLMEAARQKKWLRLAG